MKFTLFLSPILALVVSFPFFFVVLALAEEIRSSLEKEKQTKTKKQTKSKSKGKTREEEDGKRTGTNSDELRPRAQGLSSLSPRQDLRSGLLLLLLTPPLQFHSTSRVRGFSLLFLGKILGFISLISISFSLLMFHNFF